MVINDYGINIIVCPENEAIVLLAHLGAVLNYLLLVVSWHDVRI